MWILYVLDFAVFLSWVLFLSSDDYLGWSQTETAAKAEIRSFSSRAAALRPRFAFMTLHLDRAVDRKDLGNVPPSLTLSLEAFFLWFSWFSGLKIIPSRSVPPTHSSACSANCVWTQRPSCRPRAHSPERRAFAKQALKRRWAELLAIFYTLLTACDVVHCHQKQMLNMFNLIARKVVF